MNILVVIAIILVLLIVFKNNTEYFDNTHKDLLNKVSLSHTPDELKVNINNLYRYCDNSTVTACVNSADELRDQVMNGIRSSVHQFGRYSDKNTSIQFN